MQEERLDGSRQAARIDVHVGERIRRRRTVMGYTQEQLAEALAISYQQVQKYETGSNRVSAGRLYQIAAYLDVPVAFFFEGITEISAAESTMPAGGSRATIELVRAFNGISDPGVRSALASLAKSLSGGEIVSAPGPSLENGHDPSHHQGGGAPGLGQSPARGHAGYGRGGHDSDM